MKFANFTRKYFLHINTFAYLLNSHLAKIAHKYQFWSDKTTEFIHQMKKNKIITGSKLQHKMIGYITEVIA